MACRAGAVGREFGAVIELLERVQFCERKLNRSMPSLTVRAGAAMATAQLPPCRESAVCRPGQGSSSRDTLA
jgi:hypothetical protein